MKTIAKFTLKSLIAASLIFASAAPAFAADVYNFDQRHTYVAFQYNHGDFSRPTGKFMNAVGAITLDSATPANSSVQVSFDIAGVNTGVPALDDHLKTADFFDAAQFPTATFKSTKVEQTSPTTAKVTGDLTMHGVTKPVTLSVTFNKQSPDKKKVGFSATGSILRSDFGIAKLVPMVGDKVDLMVEVEAKLAQ